MAPPSGLQTSTSANDHSETVPTLARSATAPVPFRTIATRAHLQNRPDPSHLSPEDAFLVASPPRRSNGFEPSAIPNGSGEVLSRHLHLRTKDDAGSRSRSRRRKKAWKKLLWVKQSCKQASKQQHCGWDECTNGPTVDPDNYTDQATFLENLQRNPRLKPYDFWPLVADSTVIVQHVCTVIIFVVCFVGIHQQRLSPVAVVGWGSIATSVGWILWDWWVGKETEGSDLEELHRTRSIGAGHYRRTSRPQIDKHATASSVSTLPSAESSTTNLLTPSTTNVLSTKPYSASATSLVSAVSQGSVAGTAASRRTTSQRTSSPTDRSSSPPRHRPSSPLRSGRSQLRINTIKSAILIYSTLLGLSPILKSLTRSTSSDSIWAMSFWLLTINIFFFDYSGTWVGVNKFPVASLSTNAALMASTVLASRLPSTGQVFSLTLFSIEVFGLFPVFRRYARHRSWRYHVILTVLLVLGAGGGAGMILGAADCETPAACESAPWPWKSGVLGMVVGCLIAAVAMGGCSWWLIGLQKYKNEIYGPWDPARPIIISRRHWDDD